MSAEAEGGVDSPATRTPSSSSPPPPLLQQQQQQQQPPPAPTPANSVGATTGVFGAAEVEHDDAGFFWARYNSSWTYLDQRRLIGLDSLFHRSLEFHNNEFNFKATAAQLPPSPYPAATQFNGGGGGMRDSAASSSGMRIDSTESSASHQSRGPSLAFYVHHIPYARGRDIVNSSVTVNEVDSFLASCGRTYNPEAGILWLHLKDLRALASVARHFCMHELCSAAFLDLRAHSNAIATSEALAFSTSTLMMGKVHSRLYKIYAYASKGVFITYECELIPDVSIDPASAPYDVIYNALVQKLPVIAANTNLGTLYLVYEVVMEALALSNSVLEFMSRSMSYLRQQAHRNLSYYEQLTNHRKIHILISAVNMLDKHVSEWTNEVSSFLTKSSTTHFLLHDSLATNAHQPYFHDMADSYEYRSLCLRSIQSDLATLVDTMDAIINVRANQTNVNLSLVATIFLPITFLSGVFGMNFVVDGGYTMEILNAPKGPVLFYGLCIAVVLLNVLVFFYSGYISVNSPRKWVGELYSGGATVAEERQAAEKEDERRRDEAEFKRAAARRSLMGPMAGHTMGGVSAFPWGAGVGAAVGDPSVWGEEDRLSRASYRSNASFSTIATR